MPGKMYRESISELSHHTHSNLGASLVRGVSPAHRNVFSGGLLNIKASFGLISHEMQQLDGIWSRGGRETKGKQRCSELGLCSPSP